MVKKTRSRAGRRVRAGHLDAREQLLNAAIAVCAERGIANTTVAQIAAAAGVTAAMVHYWFDTRERLLEAMVEERLAPLFQHLWSSGALEHDAPIEMIHEIVRRMFEITKKLPALPALWLREVVNEGGLLREYVRRRIPMDRVGAFRKAMALGQERGVINPEVDPSLLFLSIMALVMLPQATAKTWQAVNQTQTLASSALEQHVNALLMHGITGKNPAGRSKKRRTP